MKGVVEHVPVQRSKVAFLPLHPLGRVHNNAIRSVAVAGRKRLAPIVRNTDLLQFKTWKEGNPKAALRRPLIVVVLLVVPACVLLLLHRLYVRVGWCFRFCVSAVRCGVLDVVLPGVFWDEHRHKRRRERRGELKVLVAIKHVA